MFGLFSRKPKRLPDHFKNPIHVDFHSHYLPGIDDGCKEIEESIAILTKLQEKGYTKAITTPHIMGDFYRNTPEIIHGKLEQVRQAMKDAGLTITLEAAAEYYVDEWLQEKIDQNQILTFGDKYVLIETGFMEMPPNLTQIIFELKIQGYKPVLAHPERYQYLTPGSSPWDQIMNSGVLLQLNLLSILGYYSPQTKKLAEHYIKEGLVNLIGGDVHNMKHLFLVQEEAVRHPLYGKLVELHLLNNSL